MAFHDLKQEFASVNRQLHYEHEYLACIRLVAEGGLTEHGNKVEDLETTLKSMSSLMEIHFRNDAMSVPIRRDMLRSVTAQREFAILCLIEHLKRVTGENLGDDPEGWLLKYGDPLEGELVGLTNSHHN